MLKKHFNSSVLMVSLLSLILTTALIASTASNVNLFGPKTFKRTGGPSSHYTVTFKASGREGRLVVVNGDTGGRDRVTSAVVYLNRKEIFDHSDFKKKGSVLERSVHLNRGLNKIKVELRGKRGSRITIKVTGTVTPAPTVEIAADPESIAIGASSTLTWSATNATSCFIDRDAGPLLHDSSMRHSGLDPVSGMGQAPEPGKYPNILDSGFHRNDNNTHHQFSHKTHPVSSEKGRHKKQHSTILGKPVPCAGTAVVTPKKDTTYTITAVGAGGTGQNAVTVTVVKPPTVTITADPQEILLGASSTLTWSSTNATSCNIDPGIGAVAASGSLAVKPLQTTTYTITATGIGGTHTAGVTVNVSNPTTPPYVSIGASPDEVAPGGSASLSWSSSGGESAFIDNGVGAVALSGTLTVNPVATTVYTISVTGPTGSASAEARVAVRGAAAPPPAGSFGERYAGFIPKDATIPVYDAKRFSMVTGLVQNMSGAPLAGVTVFFHDHPEYGTATTGDDGRFSIPVDGGATMTLTYKKQGLLTVQRRVNVPWNGYAVAETVKMISEDPVSTTFTFDGKRATVKTHRSTTHTDGFGSRTTTVVFTGDNGAYLVDKDGNPGPALKTITTRATEYTAPDSMPAILPPNSAYTFCAELTVDGAPRVRFQKPVVMWVENFLGFPVGSAVPVGYYDRDRALWAPSANGAVVRLLDTDGDGSVDAIDATNSGQPTDLNRNGSVADEATGLNDPSKYSPGDTYWRVEVAHFSPWDCNWPFGPPPDAIPPNPDGPPGTDGDTPGGDGDAKTCGIGSYAENRGRALHEDIPIPGADMTLHYSSKRTRGYRYTFSVPASGSKVPESLKNIHVRLDIAGRVFEQALPPEPDQKAEFSWDGLDAWGKRVTGSVTAGIAIGFEYGAFYYGADTSTNVMAFARAGIGMTDIRSRQNLFSWSNSSVTISMPPAADLDWSGIAEGWTISTHHYLDPANPLPLFRGDGSTNHNNVYVITTVAGDGSTGWGDLGDGGPALLAKLRSPMDIAADAKGNLYILDAGHHVIRKVDTSGVMTTVAGTPWQAGYIGDGDPAVKALLHLGYGGLSVDAAGNIIFSDTNNHRIRKVDSKGIITTVAGNGGRGYSGDGGPAVDAMLGDVEDIALDNAGNLYIHDRENNCIRKVDTNGMITTVAGNGPEGSRWCDKCPALDTHLRVSNNIALDAKGNLYIGNTSLNLIRRVDTAGIISTAAGMGYEYGGHAIKDGPALGTPVTPVTLAADTLGNLFFFNDYTHTLHKLDTNGAITKVAGNGTPGYSGDGGAAANAQLNQGSIAVNPRGELYFTDSTNNVVRRVAWALSRTDAAGDVHFTDDDGVVHLFGGAGSHKRSIDASTGVVLREFGYSAGNRLVSITDRFGRQTLINRDGNGAATSITSPEGVTTTLTIDANGRLTEIRYPAGETYRFDYRDDGLLTAKTEPNGNRFAHAFDSGGRLSAAGDEEGGLWQFNRTAYANGGVVATVTTGEDNMTRYWDRVYATGAVDSIITDPSGAETGSFRSADGLAVDRSLSCGMNVSIRYDLDPLYKVKVQKEVTNSTPSALRQSTTFDKAYADTDKDGVVDRFTETVTQNGKASIFEQDTLLAKRTMVSPAGRVLTSFYNPSNLLTTKLTIPGFHDTHYGYDGSGRLTTLNRNARKTAFAYNDRGFLGTMTDPENRTVSYSYDPTGRVTRITRPDGAAIGFVYDANGNTTAIRTPSAVDHGFGYNRVNLNSAYTTPFSGVYRYVYNKDKQLTRIVFPSGYEINTIYDRGNLARMETPEGNIVYTYLCGSKIGTITKGREQIAYTYDGNLPTSSTLTGTLETTLSYSYNDDFLPTSFTYAGGTVNYDYDIDGLLTRAGAFTITRDAANGLPTAVADSALTLTRSYNGYGEQSAEAYAVGGRSVAAWDLEYTNAGRIKTKTERVGGVVEANYSYTYDLAGRLTGVTRNGDLVEEYQYGANGARISEINFLRGTERTFTYSVEDQLLAAKDRLLTAGDTTYEYDVDGFLRERIQNGKKTIYHYSSRGELLKVVLPDGKSIEYIQDPLGRRIAAMVNGTITEKYLWEGQTRLLAIYDGSDNIIMRFNYADGRLPYSVIYGEDTYYLTYDQVGSLRFISDRSGNVVKRIDYDSFGNIVMIAGTKPELNVMFGFAGGLHDPDTGLVRFGYRDYNPDTGRWTAKDPILFDAGDTDLYGYVLNDPVNFADPEGLYPGHCGNANYKWVPDCALQFNFNESCRMHDDCYGCKGKDAGKTKLQCDLEFLSNMQLSCLGKLPHFGECQLAALLYYIGVSGGATDAFKEARECCD